MSAISVLLLEDEEKVRGLWVPELRRLGYVVDAASSCAEALELVRAKPFDVFVFDFLLGDGDALSVMRFARSHGCGAPTIIVSSVVTDHDVMQAGGLAHGTILRKPVLGSHIAAAIQQVLAAAAAAAAAVVVTVSQLKPKAWHAITRRYHSSCYTLKQHLHLYK